MTSPLRDALRDRLTAAMRARDRPTVGAMRSVLAALENAEAVPAGAPEASTATSQHVAGGAAGLGAGEAPRRRLTAEEERSVVAREIEELRSSSQALGEAGQHDRSAELARLAEAVEDVLAD